LILRSHDRTRRDQKGGRRYSRQIMPGVWQTVMHPLSNQPAYLLYALAIENALKGIAIGSDNELISDDVLASIIKDTRHDLREISRQGKIDLTDDDLALLDKLTATIRWVGRYPTPRKKKDLLPIDQTGKRQHAGLSYWGTDREDTRALYRRLDRMLIPLLQDRFSESAFIISEKPRRHRRPRARPASGT
jgi:hypothetical protein